MCTPTKAETMALIEAEDFKIDICYADLCFTRPKEIIWITVD